LDIAERFRKVSVRGQHIEELSTDLFFKRRRAHQKALEKIQFTNDTPSNAVWSSRELPSSITDTFRVKALNSDPQTCSINQVSIVTLRVGLSPMRQALAISA